MVFKLYNFVLGTLSASLAPFQHELAKYHSYVCFVVSSLEDQSKDLQSRLTAMEALTVPFEAQASVGSVEKNVDMLLRDSIGKEVIVMGLPDSNLDVEAKSNSLEPCVDNNTNSLVSKVHNAFTTVGVSQNPQDSDFVTITSVKRLEAFKAGSSRPTCVTLCSP